MLITKLLPSLVVGVALSSPSKFYCHFYEYLQAVCLQTKTRKGLLAISLHEVHARSNRPHEPLYESATWRIPAQYRIRKGVWSLPTEVSLPWPIDLSNVSYTKVDATGGEAGYYDVNFTMNSAPRRFTKLTPLWANELSRDGQGQRQRFVFTADHPFAVECIVTFTGRKSYLFPTLGKHMAAVVGASDGELHFKDISDPYVERRTLEARYRGYFYIAKAFVFLLPTRVRQYGTMFRYRGETHMLFRKDEVELRGHHMLPPHRSQLRYPGLLPSAATFRPIAEALPSYEQSIQPPPSYEEAQGGRPEESPPPYAES
ncbi:hypothetical protein FOZ60_010526 [Perkinsus olseni]|uniref:Uncharacterized protein n=2 Tax=Perkinsus olseni TaxID=32597 RepID=A0A7J6PC99_PEROL|nr:hypothetical protein FOZ60_010526 [Perkinsus olseni]